MRDIFFQELRECNKNIKILEDDIERKQGYELLCKTVEIMCELTSIARHEGLLALEEAALELGEFHNKDYLNSIILLIVDGTDPKLVEELGTAKYFATGVSGFDALQYLIMLSGSLAIQAGENPRVIEEKLLSLVPDEVVRLYEQKQEEYANTEQKMEGDSRVLEKYYKGDIAVEPGDEYYFQLKIIDYALKSLDDRSTQRLLRDIENSDLALALMGLSGTVRKHIFSNLSLRLAVMIAKDMEFMKNVELRDVADASFKIFNVMLRLIDSAEIVCKDVDAMLAFGKIFDITADIKRERNMDKEEMEIFRIMRDYCSATHRTINLSWKDDE